MGEGIVDVYNTLLNNDYKLLFVQEYFENPVGTQFGVYLQNLVPIYATIYSRNLQTI